MSAHTQTNEEKDTVDEKEKKRNVWTISNWNLTSIIFADLPS